MKPRRFVRVFFALLTVVCTACATKQLSDFKNRLNAQDYAWITQQNVGCEEVDDVCGQLHLIKGDACFRLAKQNTNAAQNYSCAATELDKGIRMTKTWQQGDANLNRPQTYANLCEALHEWQDMERGAMAEQITQRLLDTSKRFLDAEPHNPAALYYNTSARYTQLQSDILDPRNPQGLCQSLNGDHG